MRLSILAFVLCACSTAVEPLPPPPDVEPANVFSEPPVMTPVVEPAPVVWPEVLDTEPKWQVAEIPSGKPELPVPPTGGHPDHMPWHRPRVTLASVKGNRYGPQPDEPSPSTTASLSQPVRDTQRQAPVAAPLVAPAPAPVRVASACET